MMQLKLVQRLEIYIMVNEYRKWMHQLFEIPFLKVHVFIFLLLISLRMNLPQLLLWLAYGMRKVLC